MLRLDPRRDAAWRRLGYKKQAGRWVKPDLVTAQKAEKEDQTRADRFWKPKLERWRDALSGRDKTKKAAAQEALAQISDPRAVPMVWSTFAQGGLAQQHVAVQTLSQLDSPAASRALALLAVFSGQPEIRGEAIAILRRRDPREFAEMLIGMIRQPIQFEVKRVGGPGAAGELFIKGRGNQANLKRVYSPPPGPDLSLQPGDRVVYDEAGLPVIQRPTSFFNSPWVPAASLPSLFGYPNSPMTNEQKQRVMGFLRKADLAPRLNSLEARSYPLIKTMPMLAR